MSISDEFMVQPLTISFDQDAVGLEAVTYKLYQNIPNPFGNTTAIRFELPERMSAKLTIYNQLGQKVKQYEQVYDRGEHIIEVGRKELGQEHQLFYYNLQTSEFTDTKSMILLK